MKITVAFFLMFLLLSCSGVSAKTVYCSNCSDKFMQAIEKATGLDQLEELMEQYYEMVQQTAAQLQMVQQNIEQYTNMVQNTIQLPANLIRKISGQLSKLGAITGSLNTMRSDIVGLGNIFDGLYEAQDELKNLANLPRNLMGQGAVAYHTSWDRWSERVDDATKATFQLSGKQLQDLQDSGELESYINDLLSTPDGQQRALMAGNQLAALQIQEARQLRELLATKIQSDLASQEKAEKEGQMDQEHERHMLKKRIGTSSRSDPF